MDSAPEVLPSSSSLILNEVSDNYERTKFNNSEYLSQVGYSRHCMYIDGRPRILISGEFHYWRIPDHTRWRTILLSIKSSGFNCVRLYFNWGFHSPSESKYYFDSHRDIDYLLTLCEDLQLFVIAAPGPYICAETQAGGFPSWLLAKRNVRIRHLRTHLIKKYDIQFARYSIEWYNQIVPIIVRHERIQKSNGCVIAFQIENEIKQLFGLDQEMRDLANAARALGIKSPIFHNDDMAEGSWSAGARIKDAKTLWMSYKSAKASENSRQDGVLVSDDGPSPPRRYRGDLYGVDLYFLFPRMKDYSDDQSAFVIVAFQFGGFAAFLQAFGIGGIGLGGRDLKFLKSLGCFDSIDDENPPPLRPLPPIPMNWSAKNFRNIDKLESRMEIFGGAAASAPAVYAETQVGWINQWGKRRNYDDLYNFFGGDQSATLLVSLAAQGASIVSFYMAYGGTNWGTSGDAEVYTSYDYCAFIREFGKLSQRGRRLRSAVALFLQSFQNRGVAETHLITHRRDSTGNLFAECSLPSMLIAVREADGSTENNAPKYLYLRNLSMTPTSSDPSGRSNSTTRFSLAIHGTLVVPCELTDRQAFIAPANINVDTADSVSIKVQVLISTIPVVLRASNIFGAEFWALRIPSSGSFARFILKLSTIASLTVRWTREHIVQDDLSMPESGLIPISQTDVKAAGSLLSIPLEEVSMKDFEPPLNPTVPLSIQSVYESSTHPDSVLLSFAFWRPCLVLLSDEQQNPLLRMLVVSNDDADTLVCHQSTSETAFSSSTQNDSFVLTYGASESSFAPDTRTLELEWDESNTSAVILTSSTNPISGKSSASDVIPGLSVIDAPSNEIWKNEVPFGENSSMFVELSDVRGYGVDFSSDVEWKSVESAAEFDPLDHLYTHGHVAYRCQFETAVNTRFWQFKSVSLTINVRHIATVWMNGHNIGGQLTYSHCALSAGAMHFMDFSWAGKKTYDLTPFLNTESNGSNGNARQEVVILVHSLGQNRQAFLLNDVRNQRGLLSASLSGSRVDNVSWQISGIATSSVSDPFNIGGVPCEDKFRESSFDDSSWEKIDAKTDKKGLYKIHLDSLKSVQWTRMRFPTLSRFSNENNKNEYNLRVPLRVKIQSSHLHASVFLYVNGFLIGRWISDLGPQDDFYVPEHLLIPNSSSNVLSLAMYAWQSCDISVELLPWIVDPDSGNLSNEANAKPFRLLQSVVPL